MGQHAFQHRSGRIISLTRLLLASVFLIAIWADPSQPSRYAPLAYGVLATYVAISAAYMAVTWNNWWLEHGLAIAAHSLDIGFFALMVYLTEGYTSPFFIFSVFLILSATIRWGWRETGATAAAVILLFFLAGLAALKWHDANFEVARVIIRGSYLLVLSLLLIWFGFYQEERYLRRLPTLELWQQGGRGGPPMRAGLEQAVARTGAHRAMLAWWEHDEPWLNIARLDHGLFTEGQHAPVEFDRLVNSRVADCVFIFDSRTGHTLVRRDGSVKRLNDLGEPLDWRFQAGNLTQTGLAIPVQTDDYGCLFVLSDIPGLCSDDLAIGERFREDFAALLDRMSLQSMLQQKAANRTRLSLARDLHDSVAQVLAGTLLRLEGLRQSIQAGRKVEEEIDALQQELQIEQRGLRALISQLRGGPLRPDTLLLGESLLSALERASRQWGIACELVRYPENTKIGAQLQHELSQLIREAVANAAKHGRASRVLVFVDLLDSEVLLRVRDNGSGFDLKASRERGAKATPWSLNERIHELGGTLMLSSMSAGSELTMRLPWAPGR